MDITYSVKVHNWFASLEEKINAILDPKKENSSYEFEKTFQLAESTFKLKLSKDSNSYTVLIIFDDSQMEVSLKKKGHTGNKEIYISQDTKNKSYFISSYGLNSYGHDENNFINESDIIIFQLALDQAIQKLKKQKK